MIRATYLEHRWPDAPVFQQVASRWSADHSYLLLAMVWRGYDLLVKHDLHEVVFSQDFEAKEESLNFLLAIRIDQCKTGDEPFCVTHQPPEQTKRKRGRGRSPQPDIGFALYDCPRTIWPIEGKVLDTESAVTSYILDLQSNLLTGRYATFSSEGAMVGYLFKGDPAVAFVNIGSDLRLELSDHPHFLERAHKTSEHQRDSTDVKVPPHFICHHLLLRIGNL